MRTGTLIVAIALAGSCHVALAQQANDQTGAKTYTPGIAAGPKSQKSEMPAAQPQGTGTQVRTHGPAGQTTEPPMQNGNQKQRD